MFKPLPLKEFYHLLGFGPLVMITSGDEKRPNAAPIAWTTPVNDEPPLAGIALASGHYTTALIRQKKQFVINIPDVNMLKAVKFCGSVSGREGDKFKKAGLAVLPGIKVKTPHLRAAVGFVECVVKDIRRYDGVSLIVGKVLFAGVRSGLYKNGVLTPAAHTFHHMGGGTFARTGKRLR